MIDYIEATHEYSVRGRVLPSVTRILVALGLLHTVDDESALWRGRAVHEACRMVDQGCLDRRSIDDLIAGYLESWERLYAVKKFRILTIERKVASVKMGCAGRYDRDVLMDGDRYILDLKTGEIQELPVRLQLVAYAEMKRLEPKNPGRNGQMGRIAVRLFSDGSMAAMERFNATDYQRDLRGFYSAVNLYGLKVTYGN